MSMSTLPMVVRSWEQLRETDPTLQAEGLPISQEGTTYIMAQELSWVDLSHFAVGRWDGSMSIFRFSESSAAGPVITAAVSTPSAEGVQMISWLASGVIVTSNDGGSCTVWRTPTGAWADIDPWYQLSFSDALGVANSATSYVTPTTNTLYVAIGHANGFVSLWQGASDGSSLTQLTVVNAQVSSPHNPWGLQNVRGIANIYWNDDNGFVVTGSENGYMFVIRLPDGEILSQTPYNPTAQRGINSISTAGQNLLVANCMVGENDKNLWYYWINDDWSISLRDSAKLQVAPHLAQVFNFDVIWGYYGGGLCWFSATEEGYLWMGSLDAGNAGLKIIGNQSVTQNLGAALGMTTGGDLAVVANNLYEFNTTPAGIRPVGGHPEACLAPLAD